MSSIALWKTSPAILAAGYLAGVTGLYRFAFHPKLSKARRGTQGIDQYPELSKIQHEEVNFNSREKADKHQVPINGTWFTPKGKQPEKAVILVPGRGHHQFSVPAFYDVIQTLVGAGAGVMVIDPRTMGKSGGKRSTLGLEEKGDVLGAYDYLKELGIESIGGLGMSQGAHALLLAAAEPDVKFEQVWADSPHENVHRLLKKEAHQWLGLPNQAKHVLQPFISAVLAISRLRGMDFRTADMTQAVENITAKGTDLQFSVHENDPRYSFENTKRLAETALQSQGFSSKGRIQERMQDMYLSTKGKPGHTVTLERLFAAERPAISHKLSTFFDSKTHEREAEA